MHELKKKKKISEKVLGSKTSKWKGCGKIVWGEEAEKVLETLMLTFN